MRSGVHVVGGQPRGPDSPRAVGGGGVRRRRLGAAADAPPWLPVMVAHVGGDVRRRRRPLAGGDVELLRAAHHADQTSHPHELRSEWVTALADAAPGSAPVLLGFDGAGGHDGTFRPYRVDADRDSSGAAPADAELTVEAFLGDATFAPGRAGICTTSGSTSATTCRSRSSWSSGRRPSGPLHRARVAAPFPGRLVQLVPLLRRRDPNRTCRPTWSGRGTGPSTCSNSTTATSKAHRRLVVDQRRLSVLARCDRRPHRRRRAHTWPVAGAVPVGPDSDTARRHPDWIARRVVAGEDRGPLGTWWNPDWGSGRGGLTYGLDTTHPAALDHLEWVARSLVDAGFRYLKLDFTFSPSADGGYADPSRTPAERVRAGFDAIRRGAGRRRVHPRVRGAPVPRGGRRRREPDRPRHRPLVVAAAGRRGRTGLPRRATVDARRQRRHHRPFVPYTGACG